MDDPKAYKYKKTNKDFDPTNKLNYDDAWVLLQNKCFSRAIEAFRKSLLLQEDWKSYQGLGWALFKTNQFKKAIKALRKTLEMKEDWNSYQGLAWA